MFLSEWREFSSAPCLVGKKTWWQLASRYCWNRARPWHASEVVLFRIVTVQPGRWVPVFRRNIFSGSTGQMRVKRSSSQIMLPNYQNRSFQNPKYYTIYLHRSENSKTYPVPYPRPGSILLGLKLPRREACHSPPSISLRMLWAIHPFPNIPSWCAQQDACTTQNIKHTFPAVFETSHAHGHAPRRTTAFYSLSLL